MLQNPVHLSDSKSFCCMCCKDGPLDVTMETSKQGFVCGEKIAPKIEVDNKSTKKMDAVKMKLKMA